jgi:predicted Zn-dependent peptidase
MPALVSRFWDWQRGISDYPPRSVVGSAEVRGSALCRSIALAVCVAAACSREQLPKVKSAARMPAQVLDRAQTGTRIATLPRPSSGVVRLALFIDAGSRDVVPAQTATFAAWLAAANGGPGIEATVYPDVTELALECSKDALSRCVDALARALSTREPDEEALSRARLQLREGQRRALAHEPFQALDNMAVTSLLGADAAQGFFPLGQPGDDATLAADGVAKFLRDHYGPARTLLVAAGDAEPEQVREAVSASFTQLTPAALPRSPRELRPAASAQLAVGFDAHGAIAVAIAGRDPAQLQAVIASAAAAVNHAEPHVELAGSVFAARGGALAVLHAHSTDSELALDHLVRELARLQLEPAAEATAPSLPDDLVSSSRAFGLDFGAESSSTLADFQFGAALLLEAGVDAGPKGKSALENGERARSEHAQAAFARALAQAQPHTRGDLDQYGAAVVAENGARIDVQYAQGDDVAIAVRVGYGAEQDPPLLLGQTALLATLTSMACAGMGPELLRSRLAALGASLEPRVDAESYGLALRVPKQHWQDGLDLALRCMRAPSRQPGHFTDAAVLLLARLRKQTGALGYRARAAALVAPRSPGQCAPWGDPARVGNLNARVLDGALRETQWGARWAIGIVGPVAVQEAVDRSARRLADLPPGTTLKPVPPGEYAPGLQPETPRAINPSSMTVVAAWVARGRFEASLGARVFARALGTLLAAIPGIELLWHDGDVHGELGFAALALRIRPSLADSLPQLLAAAARSLDDRLIDKALEPAVALAKNAQNAADAQVAVRAERIARIRLGAPLGEPDPGAALKLLQALRGASARWVVVP